MSERAPPSFDPEHFALATVTEDGVDDGVLLDLVTGEFFRVRGSALVAVNALLSGRGIPFAARAVARAFHVDPSDAERDVKHLLRGIRSAPPRARKRPFSFRADKDGFTLRVGATPVARLYADGSAIERRVAGRLALRLAAPHLLALRGTAVLHASSVRTKRGVLAFVGPSGVGKTTLARIFARRGLEVLGGDLLVLARGARPRVRADGEAAIFAWTRTAKKIVRASPLEAAGAATIPLAGVFLLERGDADEPVRALPLARAEAMVRLFTNAFIELPSARVWADALTTSRALATRGLVRRLRVPGSLDALPAAVDAWEKSGFSRVTPQRITR